MMFSISCIQRNKLISERVSSIKSQSLGDIENYFKEQRALGIVPARFSEITLQGVSEEVCICGRPVEQCSDNEEYVEACYK